MVMASFTIRVILLGTVAVISLGLYIIPFPCPLHIISAEKNPANFLAIFFYNTPSFMAYQVVRIAEKLFCFWDTTAWKVFMHKGHGRSSPLV